MTVKVEGAREAADFFNELAKGGFLRRPLGVYGRAVVKATAPYPRPPAGSKYRRTGTLGRGWNVIEGSKSVIIRNPTNYAGWVQASPTQAWFHKGRWANVDEQAKSDTLQRELVQNIVMEIGRMAAKTK